MQKLSRREALMLLAGLGGISLLPVQYALADALPAPLARFTESLDVETAAQLGRNYLERYPEDADVEHLLDTLLRDAEGTADVRGRLDRKVAEDFAGGCVVDLENWQVSRTEARIFASLALTV